MYCCYYHYYALFIFNILYFIIIFFNRNTSYFYDLLKYVLLFFLYALLCIIFFKSIMNVIYHWLPVSLSWAFFVTLTYGLCILNMYVNMILSFTSERFFRITDGKTLRDVRWFFPDAGTQGRKAQRRIPSAEFCFQGWQYEFLNHLALKHQLDMKRFNMYTYM